MLKGNIHSIFTGGTVDGPGIRTVIFFKGCNLRCGYCHNPDTWSTDIAQEKTVEELVEFSSKYMNYYGDKGGVTCSGGDPLMQIDFLIEFFKGLKAANIKTCLDTSGYDFDPEDSEKMKKFDELIKYTDLVLLDIKHIDNEKCIKLTGKHNKNTLAFGKYLSDNGIHMWIRQVLVPGWTDDVEDLRKARAYIETLATVDKIEVLPYHTMGKAKYQNMGISYRFDGIEPPTKEFTKEARMILRGEM